MRPFLATRDTITASAIDGAVLCQDLPDNHARRSFRKGRILTASDLDSILATSWDELHLVRMDDGDVHEDEAGERLARAAAGRGIVVGSASAGHWPLSAETRGLVAVSVDSLARVNAIEGLCVYTLQSGHVVDAGDVVARAKITPFVMAAEAIGSGEALAYDGGGLVSVRPFVASRIAAVVQESIAMAQLARFERALGEKVEWLGSTLLSPHVTPPRAEAIATEIERAIARDADVVIVAGAKAMDPLEPVFRALTQLEAHHVRHGVPAHPGSLFWLAELAGTTIIGMPTCGLFSQATVFDLVLPRLLSGERIDAAALAALGHGGLLTRDMAYRFPPYRPSRARGALESTDESE